MKQELTVSAIERFVVECQKCNTQVIVDIGKTVKECPICKVDFNQTNINYQEQLHEAIKGLKVLDKIVKFKIVCKED